MLHEQQRVVAEMGEAGLERRRPSLAPGSQRKGRHRRAPAQALRQRRVGVGQMRQRLLECRLLVARLRPLAPQPGEVDRRHAVRLREQDVERHRLRAQLAQPVDQPGDLAARPGPLAQPLQALLVDIDDAHRLGLINPRQRPLIAVEHQVAQLVDEGRLARAQQHRRHHDQPGNRHIQPALHARPSLPMAPPQVQPRSAVAKRAAGLSCQLVAGGGRARPALTAS
jgi:hypothetical protein